MLLTEYIESVNNTYNSILWISVKIDV